MTDPWWDRFGSTVQDWEASVMVVRGVATAVVAAVAVSGSGSGVASADELPPPGVSVSAPGETEAPGPVPSGGADPAAPAAQSSPVDGAPQVGARSGLPFDLGVFAHSPDRVARFEEKVGRKVDVWQVAPQREEGAGVMLSETRRIVGEAPEGVIFDLAVPLVSRGEARELGKALAARPGAHYVRPGWEFNLSGSWAWTVDRIGADAFKKGFVEAAAGFREGCPSCRIEWNPNSGRSGGAVEGAAEAWPGDEWVDVVGVDVYDWADGDGGDAAFTGPGGLDEWAAFTRQHGKTMSLPEWGVHGVQGRGDDAEWAGRVIDWVIANRDAVVMASYFDEPADYIKNSIGEGQMPATGDVLRARFEKLADTPAPAAVPSGDASGEPVSDGWMPDGEGEQEDTEPAPTDTGGSWTPAPEDVPSPPADPPPAPDGEDKPWWKSGDWILIFLGRGDDK